MKRPWLIACVIVATIICLVAFRIAQKGFRGDAEMEKQLKLAWAEGLPTNAVEFKSTIQPVPLSENAAPYYRKLSDPFPKNYDLKKLTSALIATPNSQNVSEATKLVEKSGDYFKNVDRAAELPQCWFDRDWSQGSSVVFPEYSRMKNAALMLRVRGSLAAKRGDSDTAIRNANEIFSIAHHVAQEPMEGQGLISQSIYLTGLHCLADWAYIYRNIPGYPQALKDGLDRFPQPDLKKEYSGDLFLILSATDHYYDRSGREALGIKEPYSGSEQALSFFTCGPGTRLDLIREERDFWAAFNQKSATRESRQREATDQLDRSLIRYPVIREWLMNAQRLPDDRLRLWEAHRQLYSAACLALSGKAIPHKLSTEAFGSPFDGKALNYSFDGKHIKIEVSGKDEAGDSAKLTIPPVPES